MSELKATNQVSVTNELKENPDSPVSLQDVDEERMQTLTPIVQFVKSKYQIAKMAKRKVEQKALDGYTNFRGIKDTSTAFSTTEISKAFIKITKTKVLASFGQISEVIFADNKLPIEIVASTEPLGIVESAHIDPQDPVQPELEEDEEAVSVLGFPGDGRELKPGDTVASRMMGFLANKFKGLKVKMGAGDGPNRIQVSPAEAAAMFANKRIQDQLEDMEATTTVWNGLMELIITGTGVIKGPFNYEKEYPQYSDDGRYEPVREIMPLYRHVSFWDIFPDPDVRTQEELDKDGWIIQRHRLGKSKLRDLKKNRTFLSRRIDTVVNENNPDYIKEDYENKIEETDAQVTSERWEVLEFWGKIDQELAESENIDLGFEWPDNVDELPCNIWIAGGEIIRFVINPFTPTRIPYLFANYEVNPYSLFGIGLPENMEDTQKLMNGFMRLAVDNAVLSGTLMLEIDESVLSVGQEYKIEPGKIWRKNVSTQAQAIRSIDIKNVSQANMQMFEQARRLADEATGIPSFSHGLTGVQGVGRTAGGISMLLGAASLATKTVVKGLDERWFKPMGRHIYHWNLQHKFDKRMIGDLSIVARGISNLTAKTTKIQNMLTALQVVGALPQAIAYVNLKEYIKQLFQALDLGTEKLLNRPEEYKMQLQLMMMMQQKQQQQGQVDQGQDVNNPALPGQQGFTGTPQEQGQGGLGGTDPTSGNTAQGTGQQ